MDDAPNLSQHSLRDHVTNMAVLLWTCTEQTAFSSNLLLGQLSWTCNTLKCAVKIKVDATFVSLILCFICFT